MKTAKCNPPPSLLPFPVAPRLALCKNIQDNKKVEDCSKLNCVAPQLCSDDNTQCYLKQHLENQTSHTHLNSCSKNSEM